MKKLIFTSMLVGAVALSVQAQEETSMFWSSEKADKPVQVGIRLGLNSGSASVSETMDDDFNSKLGFNAGLSVDFSLNKNFYINSGLFYSTKGIKYEGGEDEEEWSESLNAGFLEIPIYASYRMNFSNNNQFQIFTGPYFGFGINGKMKYEGTYGDDEGENEYDLFGTDDDQCGFKRFEFGWGLGAAWTYSNIYVGLQYQFGLNNMHDDKVYDKEDKLKFNTFSISIGYNF